MHESIAIAASSDFLLVPSLKKDMPGGWEGEEVGEETGVQLSGYEKSTASATATVGEHTVC